MANRKSYYEILEQTQKDDLGSTQWIARFCNTLNETFADVLDEIEQTIQKTNYWRKVDQVKLSSEQTKVLNRLLDGDFPEGINTSQYHKVAKVSKPTVIRHLAYLVAIGCLKRAEAGD
ncbi:fic family protein [Vibrio sp. JCM 19236]|nr:fic family protein [Vibrio sp. JCM 19236]